MDFSFEKNSIYTPVCTVTCPESSRLKGGEDFQAANGNKGLVSLMAGKRCTAGKSPYFPYGDFRTSFTPRHQDGA